MLACQSTLPFKLCLQLGSALRNCENIGVIKSKEKECRFEGQLTNKQTLGANQCDPVVLITHRMILKTQSISHLISQHINIYNYKL